MKVLTVSVATTTMSFLQGRGVVVEEVPESDVESIIDWLKGGEYDACLVDLSASGLGVYLPREIREADVKATIIGLSDGEDGGTWSDQRSTFLEQGGDDLLRLPGTPRELVATLRAYVRRSAGTQLDIVECMSEGCALKVNATALLVTINEVSVSLTGKELLLLLTLARSLDRVVTKETLLSRMYVYGIEEVPEIKIIDVFICKLRKKLANVHPKAGQFVETVWGQGYRLKARVA